ncbi:hypothetical protein [Rhodopirellula sp. SWK7]|uniref:anti-sigma factor family protein n=1 Tax=Rhodopirellula sp. SWK7 TaxID=595460 RepID=UPI0006942ED9|nr:hypothetical protein [Rhodopirellula sp. SWK7]
MPSLSNRLWMILTLKCGQASILMSDSLDRKLLWHERLALRGHLIACRVCPTLKTQLETIARTSRRKPPSDINLSSDAKQRLKETIRASQTIEE